MSDRNLVESFLVHKLVVVAVMIEILMGTTFYAYVFQLFADVEAAFKNIAVDYIFQLGTHESITFSRFYMQEFDAEIQFAVHADASSVFNVLGINHTFIVFIIIMLLRCFP